MKYITLSMIIFFLMCFVSMSCTKKGQTEKEPNNSFAAANEISHENRILGFMDSANDRDFYILHIENRGIIDIQVSGVKGINLVMKIWKGQGDAKLIKWIDDNRKSSPERIANLSVTPGTYFIEILQSDRDAKKINNESPYELTLKTREAISEESEPNDAKNEADTLYVDKDMTGYFSPAYNRLNDNKENLHREEDWFVVDVSVKSDSPVLLDVSLSGVTEINSVLSIYDSDDNLIATADNGVIGEPESLTGIGIQKSGSYFIMVASKTYTANHDEPYTLKVTQRQHDSGAEMEPNNSFDNANIIVNNVITGRMSGRDDNDVFLYPVSKPSTHRIELRPPDDMDAMLTIYNADKEKVIDLNASGRGKKEIYPNYYSDKEFYILVSSKSSDTLSAGEYILSVTPSKSIESQEQEPNNEVSTANRITGRTATGYTSYKGDKDYFLLNYDARVKEKFEIRGVKGGEIKVSVTDPLGYIIKSVDVQGDRKVSFKEMIDKKAYVIIESVTENYDNPYTIMLRGNE